MIVPEERFLHCKIIIHEKRCSDIEFFESYLKILDEECRVGSRLLFRGVTVLYIAGLGYMEVGVDCPMSMKIRNIPLSGCSGSVMSIPNKGENGTIPLLNLTSTTNTSM